MYLDHVGYIEMVGDLDNSSYFYCSRIYQCLCKYLLLMTIVKIDVKLVRIYYTNIFYYIYNYCAGNIEYRHNLVDSMNVAFIYYPESSKSMNV